MQWKLASVAFILLTQAFGPLVAQTSGPPAEDSQGLLSGLAERARDATTRVKQTGGAVLDFAGFYYNENLKPVTDSYWDWASSTTSSMWENVQKTIDNFRPSPPAESG